jgi:hypothetical protein
MMVHVEGDIVDSLYESFLISWSTRLRPPLPCVSTPATTIEPREYLFSDKNPYLERIEITKAAKAARALLRDQNEEIEPEGEKRRSLLGTVARYFVFRHVWLMASLLVPIRNWLCGRRYESDREAPPWCRGRPGPAQRDC